MIKVSVIVPVYNVEKYLEKCLTTLVNQTLKDIEIIVVNDGTKDYSQDIIDKFVKKYPKLIKSFIKPNGGLSDARNYGLKKAKGEYIGFVDGDDYIDTRMYEKLYEAAAKEQSDIAECNFYWCYPNKMRLDKTKHYNSLEDIMLNIRVVVWNKIYKKSIIEKYNVTFPVGLIYEDIPFAYKILPHINKIAYVDEGFYYYIQRGNSISNRQTEKVRHIFADFDGVIKYYKDNKIYKKYEPILEYVCIKLLFGSSFYRILQINDKKLRSQIINENWLYLNKKFPSWRKNIYLKKIKSFRNFLFRYFTNIFTYYFAAFAFRLKSRLIK